MSCVHMVFVAASSPVDTAVATATSALATALATISFIVAAVIVRGAAGRRHAIQDQALCAALTMLHLCGASSISLFLFV